MLIATLHAGLYAALCDHAMYYTTKHLLLCYVFAMYAIMLVMMDHVACPLMRCYATLVGVLPNPSTLCHAILFHAMPYHAMTMTVTGTGTGTDNVPMTMIYHGDRIHYSYHRY